MSRIAKVDYFAGAFISTILKSSKSTPAMFNASDESKRIVFETDLGKFNVYIKYSTTEHKSFIKTKKRKRTKKYWNVNFTQKEYEYLLNNFSCNDKINLIAIVCSNKTLADSKIAILTLDEALFCLRISTDSGNRTITISRIGKDHQFNCYGVGLPHEMEMLHITPYVNHLRYFDSENQNELLSN